MEPKCIVMNYICKFNIIKTMKMILIVIFHQKSKIEMAVQLLR